MQKRGLCCLALVLAFTGSAVAADDGGWVQVHVQVLTIPYRTPDGDRRSAYLVLPDWYGPRNNPPLPLIISPRRRGRVRRGDEHGGALPGFLARRVQPALPH